MQYDQNLPSTKPTLVIAKEKVVAKSLNKYNANELQENLELKLHQQKTREKRQAHEVTIKKENSQYNTPEDLLQGNSQKWHSTSLGEVGNLLRKAYNCEKLTFDDFAYLNKCLYSHKDGRHEIARCDPAIFEILKLTTANQQKLPDYFVDRINKVLRDEIMHYNEEPQIEIKTYVTETKEVIEEAKEKKSGFFGKLWS
jgi:hypothetical protein